jgi:hypothetical protein
MEKEEIQRLINDGVTILDISIKKKVSSKQLNKFIKENNIKKFKLEDDKENLLKSLRDGIPVNKLSFKYNISTKRLDRMIINNKNKEYNNAYKKGKEKKEIKIVQLRRCGYSVRLTKKTTKCTETYLYYAMRKYKDVEVPVIDLTIDEHDDEFKRFIYLEYEKSYESEFFSQYRIKKSDVKLIIEEINKKGFKPIPIKKNIITMRQKKMVINYYKNGMKRKDIAEKVGVSLPYVGSLILNHRKSEGLSVGRNNKPDEENLIDFDKKLKEFLVKKSGWVFDT